MGTINPGQKFVSRGTDRNRINSILPGKDSWVAHMDADSISVTVVQSGGYIKLRVPRDAFGSNFEAAPGFSPANLGYKSPVPFTRTYI